jgi:hypothetical protein
MMKHFIFFVLLLITTKAFTQRSFGLAIGAERHWYVTSGQPGVNTLSYAITYSPKNLDDSDGFRPGLYFKMKLMKQTSNEFADTAYAIFGNTVPSYQLASGTEFLKTNSFTLGFYAIGDAKNNKGLILKIGLELITGYYKYSYQPYDTQNYFVYSDRKDTRVSDLYMQVALAYEFKLIKNINLGIELPFSYSVIKLEKDNKIKGDIPLIFSPNTYLRFHF